MATSKRKAQGKSTKNNEISEKFLDKLKDFIRTRGSAFLRDPNITSIGIGYKKKDGMPTNQISIQFTVEEKAAPELLDSLGTKQLPEAFIIDGKKVPTDVLQRNYKPSYKIRPEVTSDERKTRIDPVMPGVSIANFRLSAGTLGCIVYDKYAGFPYILSNWHVLHGPNGEIGDDITQPGPYDDNRVDENHLGKLVRSHLGAAGDCAIATIENRSFKSEILELNLIPTQLGEAELGDKVIKSGRTTGITHGIVTRIHVMVSLDYEGEVGTKEIGGFEIGPDNSHLPDNGEISMGGDSGSCWIFKSANGKPSKVLAGLHFAGESSVNTDEYALACYPKSVFEKLEISLEQPVGQIKETGSPLGRGYNPEFLGFTIPVPSLTPSGLEEAYTLDASEIVPYTHFSLALNKIRRFAFWVAWNIDGAQIRKVSRSGIPFLVDPNIPADYQADNSLYKNNRLDRGHIARRADLCWGSDQEARQANVDSFFYTNITPQVNDFNQSSQGGIWGILEDEVFAQVEVDNLKVSVIGGPIFNEDDIIYRSIKIPREFYKIIIYVDAGKLKTKGFILTQALEDLEVLALDPFKVYEVTLEEIQERTAVRFPDALIQEDINVELLRRQFDSSEERKPIESLDAIRW